MKTLDGPGRAATRPRRRRVDVDPEIHSCDALGAALHRLARALDRLLLRQGQGTGCEVRAVRPMIVEALCALGDFVDERDCAKWHVSLQAGLRAAATSFAQETGATAHVQLRGRADRVPPDVRDAFRQVVTEALRNVNRYARSGLLLLSVDAGDDAIVLDIVDDGVGLSARQVDAWGSSVDLGLQRMHRAVQAVGGHLTVHPLEPRGLRLRAAVPRGPR